MKETATIKMEGHLIKSKKSIKYFGAVVGKSGVLWPAIRLINLSWALESESIKRTIRRTCKISAMRVIMRNMTGMMTIDII